MLCDDPILNIAVCVPVLNELALTCATVRKAVDTLPFGRKISVHAYPTPAALLAAKPCDICITELELPGMDGFTLIDEARRRRPSAGAIVVTDVKTNEAALQAWQANVQQYFVKPIESPANYERLKTTLEDMTRELTAAARRTEAKTCEG